MLTRTSTIRSKLAVCAAAVALVAGILAAPAAAETERKRWLPNQDPAARSGNVEQGGRQVNHRNDGYDRGKPPVWSTQPGERGRKRGQEARNFPQYPPARGDRDRRHESRRKPPPPQHADRDRRRSDDRRQDGRRGPPPPQQADRDRRRGNDRRHDGRRGPPPPQYAERDHRHSDGRRHKHKGDTYNYYYGYGGNHGHAGRRHDRRRDYRRNYYSYSFYYTQPYPSVIYYPVPYRTRSRGAAQDYYGYGQGGRTPACSDGYSDGGRYVMGGSREPGGMILGGIVGAAIGSQVGGGKGRLAAVGVGTLIGALVGRDIGRTMDEADRAYATGSFGHAMEYAPTCSTITWNNPGSGSNGTVTPIQTYEPEPGRYCREFQQEVVIGGQIQDAYGTACRQPDGSWEIVTE